MAGINVWNFIIVQLSFTLKKEEKNHKFIFKGKYIIKYTWRCKWLRSSRRTDIFATDSGTLNRLQNLVEPILAALERRENNHTWGGVWKKNRANFFSCLAWVVVGPKDAQNGWANFFVSCLASLGFGAREISMQRLVTFTCSRSKPLGVSEKKIEPLSSVAKPATYLVW